MSFLTQMIKACGISTTSLILESDSILYQALNATVGATNIITRYATLPIELVDLTGTTLSANTNLGNTTADAATLIARYNGDLTINSGVTVTPAARKRGLIFIVKGNLNLSGTLSMTARGAMSVAGQRLYVVRIGSSLYEVPAVGGAGGLASSTGSTGINGGTGGGGSGYVEYGYGGSGGYGAAGTSFSGGSAGGATTRAAAGSGAVNGGAGGAGAVWQTYSAGGGAGNPGGSGSGVGGSGTGGLLIVYVSGAITITTTGAITANGVQGGAGYVSGGGSGGGSILVFSKSLTNSGSIQANGGAGGTGTGVGAAGGNGSIITRLFT